MKVGVLSLQGAVEEHLNMIKGCGSEGIKVKTVEDLEKIERLIIPGGESTAIGKLAKIYGLDKAIISRAREGVPSSYRTQSDGKRKTKTRTGN